MCIVVNCFQKFVSLLSETTLYRASCSMRLLWIAFKNLYLCCLKQRLRTPRRYVRCCELLSKICIFVVWNNVELSLNRLDVVVNCFQKFVSLLSETTQLSACMMFAMLWIAFKNLYLCCLKQPLDKVGFAPKSCELLSKICIFVVWNNCTEHKDSGLPVVNCFQKFVSLLSETTFAVLVHFGG